MAGRNVAEFVIKIRNQAGKEVAGLSSELKTLLTLTDSIGDKNSAASKSFAEMHQHVKKSASAVNRLNKSMEGMDSAATGYSSGAKKAASATEKLDESAKDATRSVKKQAKASKEAGDKSEKSAGGVKKFGGALGAVAAVAATVTAAVGAAAAGIVKFATSAGETGREYRDAARNADLLGISMEKLQAFEGIALREAGVQDAIDGLNDLNERIIDLQQNGAGEAVDLFDRFGLDVDKFADLNPVDQLREISDVLQAIPTNQRSQLLDQLGSDNLRNMAPLLAQGSANLDKLMSSYTEAGTTVTENEARRLASLGKSYDSLTGKIGGAFDRMFASVEPILTALFDSTGGWLDQTAKGNAVFDAFADGVVSAFGVAEKVFRGFQISSLIVSGAWKTAVLGIVNALDFILTPVGQAVEGVVNGILDSLEFLAGKLAPISDTAADLHKRLAGMGDFQLGDGINDLQIVAGNIRADLAESAKEFEKLRSTPLIADKARTALEDMRARRELEATNPSASTASSPTRTVDNSAQLAAAKKLVVQLSEIREQAALAAKKRDIDLATDRINEEKAAELRRINELEAAEGATAREIADMRVAAEQAANEKIAEQRRQLIQIDIDALRERLAAQQAIADAAGGGKLGTEASNAARAEIAKIEGQIAEKLGEQEAIAARLAIQNSALKEDSLSRLKIEQTLAARKAAEEQKKIDEQAAKEAADAQKKLDEDLRNARLDLLRATGRDSEAANQEIDRKYGELLSRLEKGSEDADLVEKLIDVSKAKVKVDELKQELERLNRDLDRGDISRDYYDQRVDEIDPQLREAAGETEDQDTIANVNDQLDTAQKKTDDLHQLALDAGSAIKSNFGNAFAEMIQGTKSAKDAFADMGRQILADIAKIIAQLLVELAIRTAIAAMSGGTSAAGGGLLGKVLHSGGAVSGNTSRTRQLPGYIFDAAPRYHTGGAVGLESDEVPAVLQKGEYVMSRDDPRNPLNPSSRQGQGGGSAPITVNNMIDDNSIAGTIRNDNPVGREIMNVIRANKNEIKSF